VLLEILTILRLLLYCQTLTIQPSVAKLFSMKFFRLILCSYLLSVALTPVLRAQQTVKLSPEFTSKHLKKAEIFFLRDTTHQLTIQDLQQPKQQRKFRMVERDNPNFGFSLETIWLKIVLKNTTLPAQTSARYMLEVDHAILDTIALFYQEGIQWKQMQAGDGFPFSNRAVKYRNPTFPLTIVSQQPHTFYLRVRSEASMVTPLTLYSPDAFGMHQARQEIFYGAFFGILLIMALYNLLLYFSIKDVNYLLYFLFIFFALLFYTSLYGHSLYLWGDQVAWVNYNLFLCFGFSLAFGLLFSMYFLQIKKYQKALYYLMIVAIGLNVSFTFLPVINYHIASQLLTLSGILSPLLMLIGGFWAWFRGNIYARFFSVAWLGFLTGGIMFGAMILGFLPVTFFTLHSIQLGAVLEVALLSFALGDRIKLYRKEKEEAQKLALETSLKNEQLVKEQNEKLEQKVKERTEEILVKNTILQQNEEEIRSKAEQIAEQRDKAEKANQELKIMNEDILVKNTILEQNEEEIRTKAETIESQRDNLAKTLEELKATQSQLVQAEKMASLGQLTAGIAHEINNPINFVSANVEALRANLNDILSVVSAYEKKQLENDDAIQRLKKEVQYKEAIDEIDVLLIGIKEGSQRTTEIVKGLRLFSRLDEDFLKEIDIQENIDATLMLLNSQYQNRITIEKNYAKLPKINGYPGKLNQVFMNLLTNAIQAIEGQGTINITTSQPDPTQVQISITDSGRGMPPEAQQHIFDPFFTTKDVGEGTGLGLAIALGIVEKHQGCIEVESQEGVGTTFRLKLPIALKKRTKND